MLSFEMKCLFPGWLPKPPIRLDAGDTLIVRVDVYGRLLWEQSYTATEAIEIRFGYMDAPIEVAD